jgi:hypothetical protein
VVVTPTFVVVVVRGPSIALGDQTVIKKAADDAIQVSRLKRDDAFSSRGDLTNQSVPVLVAFGERHQNQELDLFEWEKGAGIFRHGRQVYS